MTVGCGLINETLEPLNSKEVVSGIFCDQEKAVDSVNYDILGIM
jgi:hypothetical protein